jgi:hypothetical protein
MSQNTVTLKEVINDFKVTIEDADHIANSSDRALHNLAKRGMREIGFDIEKELRTLVVEVEDNDTVDLPYDFVDLCKIGLITEDGIIVALTANENITALPATANSVGEDSEFDTLIFQNYLHNGSLGRLYGIGGGHAPAHYRLNLGENRIELGGATGLSEVVLEYISDQAKLENPEVHIYAEEALRCYMYYKLIERKSGVPANEKARARTEYYNELRKARARLSTFTKENALATIRKNFMLAPKY